MKFLPSLTTLTLNKKLKVLNQLVENKALQKEKKAKN